jgi:putative SOS response-associated peptidase YedK
MCGRFTLHSRDRIKLKGLTSLNLPFATPRYNIAPAQDVLAIGNFGTGVEGRMLRWGLIPSWSVDGKGFINARAETLEQKPSFSESFRLRRCLIPANGFFEWERRGKEKRPFYIYSVAEEPLMFAGIWDIWRGNRDRDLIMSCAIITTAPNELVRELHDRMPAILSPECYDDWIDARTQPPALLRMLTPCPAQSMKMYPVGHAINSPDNDAADLLAPVPADAGQTMSLF